MASGSSVWRSLTQSRNQQTEEAVARTALKPRDMAPTRGHDTEGLKGLEKIGGISCLEDHQVQITTFCCVWLKFVVYKSIPDQYSILME